MNIKLEQLDPEIEDLIKELDGTRHLGRGVLHASQIALLKIAQTLQASKVARFPRFLSIYLPVLGHNEIALVSANLKDVKHLHNFKGVKCSVHGEKIEIGELKDSFELTLKNKGEGFGLVFTVQVAVFNTSSSEQGEDLFELVVEPKFMQDQLKFPLGADNESVAFHHSQQTVEGDLPDSKLADPKTETGKVILGILKGMVI
jgi:hypothetical protein